MRLIGVDVGGTFTDLVYADTEAGQTGVHKISTTPDDPSRGVVAGLTALCDKYGIPYTTGPLHKQYGQALRTITKLSLPNRFTKPARHDYPETPEVPRGRRKDEERPIRRTETGAWTSKAS